MTSLGRLEALFLDVTSYTLDVISYTLVYDKGSESYCWLIRMHIKEKPLQSDPFDWP